MREAIGCIGLVLLCCIEPAKGAPLWPYIVAFMWGMREGAE
jgi:hypothetical protein